MLTLGIATALPAAAHTVRSHPASGTIVTLDVGTRKIKFAPEREKAPVELALTSRTSFVRDWHSVPVSELRHHERVIVYYRKPFFGQPFVTKVLWTTWSAKNEA